MAFRLAISAGHCMDTPGKRCPKDLDPNETREWWLNDRIADKLEILLSEYSDIEVLRLDDTSGKRNTSLAARAEKANAWHADLYLAIHHNAAGRIFSGGGIVAYVNTEPPSEALEWQRLLYENAIKHTGLKGNRANPLAKASLYECRMPQCPAVLMEFGFMDSKIDCPIILTEDFADKAALSLAVTVAARCRAEKTACTVSLPILQRKSRSEAVKALQSLLNLRGTSIAVDGSFGPATEKALLEFQQTHNITADGICDSETWFSLIN